MGMSGTGMNVLDHWNFFSCRMGTLWALPSRHTTLELRPMWRGMATRRIMRGVLVSLGGEPSTRGLVGGVSIGVGQTSTQVESAKVGIMLADSLVGRLMKSAGEPTPYCKP